MKLVFVYITVRDKKEALRIGRELLKSRLVACVNILGGIRSMYWWRGKIEGAGETALVAKTRQDRLPALVRKVKSLHSYEVPCVVALPIMGGNPAFLKWIAEETAARGERFPHHADVGARGVPRGVAAD